VFSELNDIPVTFGGLKLSGHLDFILVWEAGVEFDGFLGVPWGGQAESTRSGDGNLALGGPYSDLATLRLTDENFDRMQETSKLCRLQGNEQNLND
jgi:hypothetical protein